MVVPEIAKLTALHDLENKMIFAVFGQISSEVWWRHQLAKKPLVSTPVAQEKPPEKLGFDGVSEHRQKILRG